MKKRMVVLIVGMILFSVGCSRAKPAPIFDGAYLKYKNESEYLTITFKKSEGKNFEVVLSSDSEYFNPDYYIKPLKKGGKVLVTPSLKRPNGG